jgi:uncharacterized protein (TIGR02271 family)
MPHAGPVSWLSSVSQPMDRLRHLQPGETLRIPIIEEQVVVHKGPVVIEERTLSKRIVEETQKVSDSIPREVAHIQPRRDVPLRDS